MRGARGGTSANCCFYYCYSAPLRRAFYCYESLTVRRLQGEIQLHGKPEICFDGNPIKEQTCWGADVAAHGETQTKRAPQGVDRSARCQICYEMKALVFKL